MKFHQTALPGVFQIETTPHGDARGLFARLFCPVEFADAGIDFAPTQVNLSTNTQVHTLRGMHFQQPPHAEAKLVRVIRGRAWDVAVDLRPGAGFGRWTAAELSATAMNALFLPEGIAHGFLTLEPDTQILYQMGKDFEPGHADGLCWDDPDLAIEWPAAPAVIADKDRSWPALQDRDDLTRTGGTR